MDVFLFGSDNFYPKWPRAGPSHTSTLFYATEVVIAGSTRLQTAWFMNERADPPRNVRRFHHPDVTDVCVITPIDM